MPVYEYFCSNCRTKFDALRPMSEADTSIPCEHCSSTRTARVLSLVFASAGGRGEASAMDGGGCGCGGACGCGHSHN